VDIPPWLKKQHATDASSHGESAGTKRKAPFPREPFLDKTLRHAISFIQDAMFNEQISSRNGFLQMLEPRVKLVTLLLPVFVISLLKSMEAIALFSVFALSIVWISKIPLSSFLKKLLPAAAITFFIALPAMVNLMVDGEPFLVLFRFHKPIQIGPTVIPEVVAITREGLTSAATLLLRVTTSVSFVFLMTMTTPPNTLVKSVSSLIPGTSKSLVSISYRYIFFLVRKIEQFIMGLRSRQVSAIPSNKGRHWVASRMGLLFSISMELSNELAMAMESRGFRGERIIVQGVPFTLSALSWRDILWVLFILFLCGGMVWKSFA
jgi:cobalt/nickel transport system permease protein